ncbi:uncharacterized protein [Cicer arietinum]|uniref:uncharacterized protein isoform X2 n=1 Tax=Cicer arietinum TaxID=3827 RepID=UPI003CC5B3E4
MRLMLRDAMLRLRNNGFSILALAMKVKYAELVTLNKNNMTVFAVDDLSIFSGSHSYIISATSGSTLCRTISCREVFVAFSGLSLLATQTTVCWVIFLYHIPM